jgi:hypothetical protein
VAELKENEERGSAHDRCRRKKLAGALEAIGWVGATTPAGVAMSAAGTAVLENRARRATA